MNDQIPILEYASQVNELVIVIDTDILSLWLIRDK
jgi:hypothetical protein